MSTKSTTAKRNKATLGTSPKTAAMSKNLHVVPRNEGWAIVGEGKSKATSVHDTQAEAIEEARTIARKLSGQLVIHRRDGRVRERDSYSSDPVPPKEPRKVLAPSNPPRTVSRRAIGEAVSEVIRESGARRGVGNL